MASFSVRGKNAKVRAAAVDCVRYWQRLGYSIIYLSGRPKAQQARLQYWLSVHNFPRGPLLLSEGISPHDSRHKKLNLLRQLCINAQITTIHAAYGSQKDVNIFRDCGLQVENIFVVNKCGSVVCVNQERSDSSTTVSEHRDNQLMSLPNGYTQHLYNLSDMFSDN
ncbi:hypothetical protein ACOME3_006791 [Neoechinorhynchus agilis]